MNFKRLALASLLTLACTTGQSANTDWGPHGILESALGLTSAGPITETFSFSLADTATLSSTLSLVGSFADAAYSLSSLGLDGLLGTADDVELARWSVTGTPTVNSLAMASGSYYYSLTATASGITAYAISSTATAPVPEAASWAYLALGLGAVALLARRHRRAPQRAGAPASA